MYKFKRVHIPSGQVFEEEYKTTPETAIFMKLDNRKDFLELVNEWNRLALLQKEVVGSLLYMYVAL